MAGHELTKTLHFTYLAQTQMNNRTGFTIIASGSDYAVTSSADDVPFA